MGADYQGRRKIFLCAGPIGDIVIDCPQEDSWISNANAFVAQEYDDSLQYSVRIAGFDLLAVSIGFVDAVLPC